MAEIVIKIDLLQQLEISVAAQVYILQNSPFIKLFQSFLIFVVIVILILLRTTFLQILIHGQLQVKIL